MPAVDGAPRSVPKGGAVAAVGGSPVDVSLVHTSGTRAAQPTPGAGDGGFTYFVTDEDVLEQWDGSAWEQIAINAAPAPGDGSNALKLYLAGRFR